jgi:c(7)-type cytochrome triheme protein
MRKLFGVVLILSLVFFAFAVFAADTKEPPKDKIKFAAKPGEVAFSHATHVKAAKGDCATCHPKLFPQSRAPINFKAGMHKPAETAHTSCGACHHPGGQAFETKGNCNKCHVKEAAKG